MAAQRLKIAASYIAEPPSVSREYADETRMLAGRMRAAIVLASQLIEHTVSIEFFDAGDPELSAHDALEGADALVLLGGVDVDPHRYTNDPAEIALAGPTFPIADANESVFVHVAVDRGMPILAVCRGAQLLNVTLGGSLEPDLGAKSPHSAHGRSGFVTHEVELTSGSRLAQIYGSTKVSVQSSHHQAIRRVAPGLTVTGRADDGVIESVESTNKQWIVGVQWHPEAPEARGEDLSRLVTALLEAAAATASATRI